MDIRNLLFINRSYTPIPIVLIILYLSNPSLTYFFYGLALMIIGESIRIYSVSYAGGITRTMKVGAPRLCTSGPYSRTRNPLYIGNMFIYSGVAFISGGDFIVQIFFIIILYFVFQYSMIISLEEETLYKLFGKNYEIYCANVPRFIPRITSWKSYNNKRPLNFIKTIKTEKRTLQNIILILFLIFLKENFFHPTL